LKFCLVGSCGGHLAELRALSSLYSSREHFFVVNERIELPPEMRGRTYFIRHSERDLLFFVNLWEAWRLLRAERPSVILSTGASPAVPFALVAKLLRIPFLFIEIGTQVTSPSLTGRIMYRLADAFFYQWPGLERHYRRATYGGPIQWSS